MDEVISKTLCDEGEDEDEEEDEEEEEVRLLDALGSRSIKSRK